MSGDEATADATPDITDSEETSAAPGAETADDQAAIVGVEMDSPVATRVFALLAPVVATADVELLDVEWTGGTLRVVLDHEDGVTTDSLTTVNRLVSPILDQHDPVPGRYTLEVTSPGVERPLRRIDHFRRAIGEDIIIKTIATVEPRRVKGELQSVADDSVTVDVVEIDGVDLTESESRVLALADVSTARTIFDWGPTPKVGGKHPGPKSAGQKKAAGKKKQAGKNKQAGNAKKKSAKNKPSAKQSNSQKNRNEVGDE